MGKIGQALARRAQGFGMNVVYTSRKPKPVTEEEIGAKEVKLYELLAISDFVILHIPLTDETKGLIETNALKYMKTPHI